MDIPLYFWCMHHFTHHSEENYLKTLYKLENKQIKKVNNAALANALELHPATVLQMVRKLCDNKMVESLKDKSLRLTDKGRAKAIDIIRKHRIWEVFLVDKLNYKWTEVHDLAEQPFKTLAFLYRPAIGYIDPAEELAQAEWIFIVYTNPSSRTQSNIEQYLPLIQKSALRIFSLYHR